MLAGKADCTRSRLFDWPPVVAFRTRGLIKESHDVVPGGDNV